jgi:hypothetical protein
MKPFVVTRVPLCLGSNSTVEFHAARPVFPLNGPIIIDVAFFDTRPHADTRLMQQAARVIYSKSSSIRFHALLTTPQNVPGFRVTLLALPARAKCLYDNLRRLSHGPGPQYLYKPLLAWVMPLDVRKLIVLDTDVAVLRDIQSLWAEFNLFGDALIGLVNEQNNLYQKESNWKAIGKNGGIQLLDLEAMRTSVAYASALDLVASGQPGLRIGYLGDQTLCKWRRIP